MQSTRPTVAQMRADHGIAIVSSLLVMAVIMMLGVGTMLLTQSNLMTSENLLGNSIAKANAEAGIDATVAALRASYLSSGTIPSSLAHAPSTSLPGGVMAYELASPGGYVPNGDGTAVLRIVGRGPRSAEHVSEALIVFYPGGESGGGSPFQGAVVGCEAVTVLGSGNFDSYDSRLGNYATQTPRSGAHVRTIEPGARVELKGNTPINGSVSSTGTVTVASSALVDGDINASGQVTISLPATIAGDIRTTGNVDVTNTATIAGSVSSNGSITFTNNSRVGGNAYAGGNIRFTNGGTVAGNATSAGTVTGVTWTTNVLGTTYQNAGPVNNLPVPTEECDPVGIEAVVASYSGVESSPALSVSGATQNWEISPTGIRQSSGPGGVVAKPEYVAHDVTLFGQATKMIRLPSVSISGSASLSVAGGHVVLLVDGDFSYLGGGSGFRIAEGSSLTILAKGKVHMGSSQSTITGSGLPPINIYSTYRNTGNDPWNWNAGVKVDGAGSLDASVYAPFADVNVNGSGQLYGAVRGRVVNVNGHADIHFDEALAEASLGGGSTGPTGDASVLIRSRR